MGTQCNAKCKLMYIKLPTYYRITLDRCLSLCALPQSEIQAWPMSKALMTQVEGLNGMKTDHILNCDITWDGVASIHFESSKNN